MNKNPWHRKLWAVEFSSPIDKPPFLIGTDWEVMSRPVRYPGEPTMALLFQTRKLARAWCKARMESYEDLRWRFRPVRVIERVDVVKGEKS